ncbi:MAG TPA: DUF4252 domain-containing protein [Ohtaekwangia sp.]|uniref:DUF4252 domain-containing protein n=1 Tax=Ohtaekwangia sp. TaxID=2066019 RepID=UPI002F949089
MKKIFVIALILVAVNGAFAQDAISKFFTKYQGDESFTQVTVSSKMFSLFTNMEVESKEDQEVLNAISKLKGLRILGKENTSDARALYKEAFALIPGKEFEELMSVRDKDKDMKFLIKESGGKISELVMIMGGTDDFMILSLFGEIDLKQISKIGKKMNVEGLQKLEKMNDGDKKH